MSESQSLAAGQRKNALFCGGSLFGNLVSIFTRLRVMPIKLFVHRAAVNADARVLPVGVSFLRTRPKPRDALETFWQCQLHAETRKFREIGLRRFEIGVHRHVAAAVN